MASADKTKELIEQLLRKAESTTPEEAEALTEAAEKLMLKHGIDRAMLENSTRVESEEISLARVGFQGWTQTAWANGMYAVILALKLKAYQEKYNGETHFAIIGFERDIAECVQLIESLKLQSLTALDAWLAEHKQTWDWKLLTSHEKHVEKRAFIERFGHGAAKRIRENRNQIVQEAETEAPGTALVLVSREERVEAEYEIVKKKLNLTRSRGGSYGHGTGAGSRAGYEAGQNARTGEKAVNGSRKAIG